MIRESELDSRRSRPRNISYEDHGMTAAELRQLGFETRSTHAEFDREFVTIGMNPHVNIEDLASEFDSSCNMSNPREVNVCVANALKARGVTTVSDVEFPGDIYEIDDFIQFVTNEMY